MFSEWDRIFKDPMTTLTAIDRVVHHSVVLDLMSRIGIIEPGMIGINEPVEVVKRTSPRV